MASTTARDLADTKSQACQKRRSEDVGANAKDDFDKWNLKVCNVDNTTIQAQFSEWLKVATQAKLE